MKAFLGLLDELSGARSASSRLTSLIGYFSEVSGADCEWAAALLSGERGAQGGDDRLIAERTLRAWVQETCSIAPWLFEQSAGVAGDVAETIALLLGVPVASSGLGELSNGSGISLASWMQRQARPALAAGSRDAILELLRASPTPIAAFFARWAMGKPLAPVTPRQVGEARAIATWNAARHSERFPHVERAQTKASSEASEIALESSGGELVWWVISSGHSWLWEPTAGARPLPSREWRARVERLARRGVSECVIEGELLPGAASCAFSAHDLVSIDGEDLRELSCQARRARMKSSLGNVISLARDAIESASGRSIYARLADAGHGWVRLWSPEPGRLRGVLLYAEPRHGGRGRLHTELTYGIRLNGEIVPAGRVSIDPGHPDAPALDRWIRENTRERFGPVRSVEANFVIEIEHDGWVDAPRTRLGKSLVRPRWVAWRRGASIDEVESLDFGAISVTAASDASAGAGDKPASAQPQIAFEF